MPKTLKSWKNEVGNNGLEVSWWKFCNWKAGCVFFSNSPLVILSVHPPIRTPLVFSFCQVQKNEMCRNMVIMGCGEATRWNTVTVGWEFHELLSHVARTQKQVSLLKQLAFFLWKTSFNGRQVRLYVLVGTWTNEIPHWKPFFTNVKATVQSFPQWSMFSAVQEMSSYYKKLTSLWGFQASQWPQALQHNMLESDNVTADVSW